MEQEGTVPVNNSRRGPFTALLVVLAAGVLAGIMWLLTRQDPEEAVEPVRVDEVRVSSPVAAPRASEQRQVEALDKLSGTLERGGDATEFVLDDTDLDFGPAVWLRTAGPAADFDSDGTAEDLLAELDGLVGHQATALVRLDEDGDDAAVFVLNGHTYRDSAGGAPPWQPRPYMEASASAKTVSVAAAAAVGPGARVTELERVRVGNVAWEASVDDARGEDYSVLLGADGAVLDWRRD